MEVTNELNSIHSLAVLVHREQDVRLADVALDFSWEAALASEQRGGRGGGAY